MKLHDSVVEELVRLVDIYGGHREEVKLRQELKKLDLAVYEQKNPPHDKVLVETKNLN